MNTPLLTAASALALGACLHAQATLSPPTSSVAGGLHVPIHSHETDPAFGPYGIWAVGNGYKVSFHDGMEVHPYLGPEAPKNLPVAWTTTRVSLGGRTLSAAGNSRNGERLGDFRYRYEHPAGVLEVYDVLPEGVEQSFVVPRPAGQVLHGDLVVHGVLDTPLTPRLEPVDEGAQAEIAFVDADGEAVMRYGVATAFDARGRSTPVRTSLEGRRVGLHVPAAFARTAQWPIRIDPLLAPLKISSGSAPIESDMAVAGLGSGPDIMTTASFAASASDIDTFAWTTDENLTGSTLLFSDVAAGFDTVHPSVAFARGAGVGGRWILAFERGNSVSQIRCYVIDYGESTPQNGSFLFLALTQGGNTDRNPDIGGTDGATALLAYQTDVNMGQLNTTNTDVWSIYIDATALSASGAARVPTNGVSAGDRENPVVSKWGSTANEDWVVCYQRRSVGVFGIGDWQIWGRRISRFGTNGNEAQLATSTSPSNPDLVEPDVDGFNTRFAVVARSQGTLTTGALQITRFDWSATSLPALGETEFLATSTLANPIGEAHVAFDRVSRSHWGVSFTRDNVGVGLVRVGFDASVVDTAEHSTTRDEGHCITYDFVRQRYVHAHGFESIFLGQLLGRVWTYPDDAQTIPYGIDCGPATNVAGLRPLLGTESWFVQLVGGPPATPCVLFVAFAPTGLDLTPIGMTGCRLSVDPIVTISLTTDLNGNASFPLNLTSPLDVYLQWIYLAPGLNPAGAGSTRGLEANVR